MHGPEAVDRYNIALAEEIGSHSWAWSPETVYWGGGTPSLMPLPAFAKLMSLLPGGNVTEATIECAPGTLTAEKIEAWRDCGINRVSLGVQSFAEAELRHTGRRHRAETVRDDVALLRSCGIENINIDLIAGLPHQTRETWEHSLDWLDHLSVPHASVYLFEIDEDSHLGQEILLGGQRYSAGFLPNDDLAARLYERAVEQLARSGIARYEISNFARSGFESRHNLKYWKREPYIGFGLDAHSFDGALRWGNPDELEEYLRTPRLKPEAEPAIAAEEHFFVGLRLTGGIKPSQHEWNLFAEPIQKWLDRGMLEQHGGTLRLSNAGVLLSNEIFQEFIHVQ